MTKSLLLSVVCAIAFTLTSSTASAAIFNVLGGTFDVYDPNGLFVGGVPLVGNGVLVEGVFDGSAAAVATDSSATYAGFDTALFLSNPLILYYAATGSDGLTHSAPTIDFNTMTADMSSMYANWNSTSGSIQEFNIGGFATVTPTGANMWELDFTHEQLDGPFLGFTSVVNMQISQVPVPAAVWLFGSGLIGLVGLARRKKA